MPPELGESLSQILDQIEELGVDEFPAEMEQDLRRAMMLPLTPTFPFSEASIVAEGYFWQMFSCKEQQDRYTTGTSRKQFTQATTG